MDDGADTILTHHVETRDTAAPGPVFTHSTRQWSDPVRNPMAARRSRP